MEIWHFTRLDGAAIFAGVLLLAACSSVGNSASTTPQSAVPPMASPTGSATLPHLPTNADTIAPPTVTEIPLTLTYEGAVHLFDYDQASPLDVQELSVKDQAGAAVHDITYAAHDPQYGFPIKGRMSAYLVTPSGVGSFAGVVFMHWLGQPNGNRNEFLDEAVALAPKGVVSILVQGVFPWYDSPSSYDADRVEVINQVIELRRAVDVLLSQPGVDPQRIAYVGHDYGALFGGVLSGVDHRIKTFV